MSAVATMPTVRGRLTANAPLAPLVWFKSGGRAEWLFEPKDEQDLIDFLRELDPEVPVMALGLGSNLIVRDGGVPGVVVRLGKAFAKVETASDYYVTAGAGAPGIAVSSAARDAGIANLEFLRGIPGTVGGFVRMNGGAYGREVSDILVTAKVVMRDGEVKTIGMTDLGYSYRHSNLPGGAIVIEALFQGEPGDPEAIGAEMDAIARAREESQPLRSRTGGSTFKNPPGYSAWKLIDEAGCRGLRVGGAKVSEMHCNFLINDAGAKAEDIERLGETVRARVKARSGIVLQWEIIRMGLPLPGCPTGEALAQAEVI